MNMEGWALTSPWWVLCVALGVFMLAGWIKGVVGLGLPTVSMALLALCMPTGQAAAWLLLPSLVTNVMQMRPLGSLLPVLRQLWPMQLAVVAGTLWGMAYWGPVGQVAVARQLLGVALVAYGAWGLWGRSVSGALRHPHRWGVVAGGASGLITALTGVFVVPAVAYLQALQMPRQQLMQAMGLSFTVSTITLGVGLSGLTGASGPLDAPALGVSAAMVLPALLGMALGERLRARLPAAAFKQALMGSLLALGMYLVCS